MEFNINVGHAQSAFRSLGVVAKTNTTSYEGQVLVKSYKEEGLVTFTSTDAKSAISCSFPAEVISQGEASIVYSRAKAFVMTPLPWDGEMGADKFHFKENKAKIKISVQTYYNKNSCSNSNLNLEKMKVSSFLGEVRIDEHDFSINSSVLKSAINKTSYVIDPNATKNIVKVIRMDITSNRIAFAALNNKMVSEFSVKNDFNISEGDYYLPYNFIDGLKKIVVDDSNMKFKVSSKDIKIGFDNIVFWSKTLEVSDTYPKYDSLFSRQKKFIELNIGVFLNGLSSFMDILDSDDYYRISIKLKEGKFLIETEKSIFEYPCFDENENFTIDLNGRSVKRILDSFSDEEIKLKYGGDGVEGMAFESTGYDNQRAYLASIKR